MGSAEGLVHCAFATLTHVGGSGDNPAKRQQDAYFMAVLGAEARVWGILDGHGPDNGTLAAETAAKAFTTWFEGHAAELTESPQKAMATAFEDAHNAIRTAIVRKYKDKGMPLRETQEGFLVEADGQPVDGGTTATVVALLQGHLLVVANVGDSDCLLGGYLPDGSIGFEQLCADHTPINANEYIRIAQMADHRPDDWEPAYFVYDGPDDSEDLLEIFTVSDSGQVEVDKEIADNLDELGVGYKTARFDRPCSLLVESDKYGQQKLGMTRTLGDFYMQYYGATWEPDVSCIDLFDIVAQLSQVTFVLASDGLWDIWAYKDVLKWPLTACAKGSSEEGGLRAHVIASALGGLVEETRRESADMFGESADNITATCVAFDVISPV